MKNSIFIRHFFFVWITLTTILKGEISFISDEYQLEPFKQHDNVVMLASSGRSGSTFLTKQIDEQTQDLIVLKTHLLPTFKDFKGKIIFIYSSPDKAAESALHMTLNNPFFGYQHFYNMKSSDMSWLQKIGTTDQQDIKNNLLNYDALGYTIQLEQWLIKSVIAKPNEAQILAIKYENLWDKQTIDAIKGFLNIPHFYLSPKIERGNFDLQDPREALFKKAYNRGTATRPFYVAYNKARKIWNNSPAILFLNLPI